MPNKVAKICNAMKKVIAKERQKVECDNFSQDSLFAYSNEIYVYLPLCHCECERAASV